MKLIIAGSRNISLSVEELDVVITDNFYNSGNSDNISNDQTIDEIVCGGATGMDTSGEQWGKSKNIKITYFIPDWSVGKAAGHIRNRKMGDYADQALVIHNNSPGSVGMVSYMKSLKKPCVEIIKT